MTLNRDSAHSVEILSDHSGISALDQAPFLGDLPATVRPRFLLASTVPSQWIPRAVLVKRAGDIQGIAYFKERKFGIRTGILYADFSMGGGVAARPGMRRSVFENALTHLLERPFVRGLRLRIAPEGFELASLQGLARQQGATIQVREEPYHHVIPLPADYEDLVKSFGYKARRNLRYYRRRFENGGHSYVERMDLAEFARVARQLHTRSVVGTSKEGVSRSINMFAELDHPLLAGLRRSDGEWVAIIGGWLDGGLPVVFFQMNNDRDYSSDSLCAVLRAYFFESLIRHGHRQVAFWGSVGEPYKQIAVPQPGLSVYLDVQTRSWRAIRSMIRKLGPHLPPSIQYAVKWISPTGQSR